jgi:hypothetical protein
MERCVAGDQKSKPPFSRVHILNNWSPRILGLCARKKMGEARRLRYQLGRSVELVRRRRSRMQSHYSAVGRALSQWSRVEWELCNLFSRCMALKPD